MTNFEEVQEQLYSDLRDTFRRVLADDRLVFIGARVGSDTKKWRRVLGSHGVGKWNTNGELLLAFCSDHAFVITNTIFQHKEAHKNTWMHPRSKHWHMLDNIIVKQRDVNDLLNTRAMRGADCGTDHMTLRSRMMIRRKMQHKRSSSKPPCRLSTGALKDQKLKEKLRKEIDEKLECWNAENSDLEQNWRTWGKNSFQLPRACLINKIKNTRIGLNFYCCWLRKETKPGKLPYSVIIDQNGRHTQGYRATSKDALGRWRLDGERRRPRSLRMQ